MINKSDGPRLLSSLTTQLRLDEASCVAHAVAAAAAAGPAVIYGLDDCKQDDGPAHLLREHHTLAIGA